MIGGVAAAIIAGAVMLSGGKFETAPVESAVLLGVICGPVPAVFAAVGGYAASRLLPLRPDQPAIPLASPSPSEKPESQSTKLI